jgi:hypothetical protein
VPVLHARSFVCAVVSVTSVICTSVRYCASVLAPVKASQPVLLLHWHQEHSTYSRQILAYKLPPVLTTRACVCLLHMQQGNDLNATKDSSNGDGGIRLGRLKKSGLGSKAGGAKGTIAGSTGIVSTHEYSHYYCYYCTLLCCRAGRATVSSSMSRST